MHLARRDQQDTASAQLAWQQFMTFLGRQEGVQDMNTVNVNCMKGKGIRMAIGMRRPAISLVIRPVAVIRAHAAGQQQVIRRAPAHSKFSSAVLLHCCKEQTSYHTLAMQMLNKGAESSC